MSDRPMRVKPEPKQIKQPEKLDRAVREKPLNKPKTIREIQAEKAAKEARNKSTITIANVSKQLINIHLNPPPGVDFYIGAEDIQLRPGKYHTFKKYRVRMDQITRLQKTGYIQVISETMDEEPRKEVIIKK